MKRTTV